MDAEDIRRFACAGLTALLLCVSGGDAHADFLILKDGTSFEGSIEEFGDGTFSTSELEYRVSGDRVARTSAADTIDEVVKTWSGEVGECETAAQRMEALHLAKFCVHQKRYKDAKTFFGLWGEGRGWRVETSKYYFVLSDAKPKRVREVQDRLDAIMRFYQKELATERKPKQDFVVRFFQSESAFQAFAREAGMEGAGAYYDPESRELVFWDMSLTNKNFTFQAVYHEANHQYVGDHYLGREPEHMWFSEGMATYYETAKYKRGRIVDHGRKSLDYLTRLREGLRAGRWTPLSDFLHMDIERFYCGGEQETMNYAQAWALVYFFKNTRNRSCRAFFERYVDALRDTRKDEEALVQALTVVSYDELEKAFRSFADDL